MLALKAPFPYFGGKSKMAPVIWQRFGAVQNYVEPFFGPGASAGVTAMFFVLSFARSWAIRAIFAKLNP